MDFLLKPPSLEQRALVKTAVSLWNQNDVGALKALLRVIPLRRFHPTHNEWKAIEARVLERVPQLLLPELLKEKVSCLIQTVGLQILQWIRLHCIRYDLPLCSPLEICWTPQGTVDRKRTAEALVKDESLDLSTRYKLACVYCLEDDIIALWNSMPEHLRESNWYNYPPIHFWSHTMERRGLGHAPTYKTGFEVCAYQGSKAAVEYFLQKLTPREKEECLVETAKRVTYSDSLCFLLSQMEEEQQMEVFKDNPYRVLKYFLQWPWQSFFMEIANCMWDFISKKDYDWLLGEIIYKVEIGYKDCNYHKLFTEFWQKSPHSLKSFITNEIDKSLMLPAVFHIKDKEIIRLILNGATRTVKQKLIYSEKVNVFCQTCIRDEEWDSLEFLIRECFPSKDLMSKFKFEFEKCKKWMSIEDIFVRNKHKWDKLFLSSDDSLREYEKRSDDEGESSSSKRFRSLE